jgi:hypothetical protein
LRRGFASFALGAGLPTPPASETTNARRLYFEPPGFFTSIMRRRIASSVLALAGLLTSLSFAPTSAFLRRQALRFDCVQSSISPSEGV